MGLDTVEIILWAEKEFEMSISDKDAGEIRTVGDFSSYIYRQCMLKNDLKNTLTEEIIFNKISDLLVNQYAIKANQISRDARFIQDLRLN